MHKPVTGVAAAANRLAQLIQFLVARSETFGLQT
jgi:hypothetical protein